jgi:hypothetical protein
VLFKAVRVRSKLTGRLFHFAIGSKNGGVILLSQSTAKWNPKKQSWNVAYGKIDGAPLEMHMQADANF